MTFTVRSVCERTTSFQPEDVHEPATEMVAGSIWSEIHACPKAMFRERLSSEKSRTVPQPAKDETASSKSNSRAFKLVPDSLKNEFLGILSEKGTLGE
jgi:hypothetical protein